MRLEFDRAIPVQEQRDRVANVKEPGRKHQKRKGAKALEREKATRARRSSLKAVVMRKYKNKVAEYWSGSRLIYPKKPNLRNL